MTAYRSNGFTENPLNPANTVGKKHRSVFFEATITAAANENDDVWILAGPLSLDSKIAAVIGATPAFTAANNNDLGFWKRNPDGTFSAIDADILWDGVDLSSALSYRELLGTLNTSLDRDKSIGELLGISQEKEPFGGVYLGLQMKTASTATSEVLKLETVIEEATTN